MLIVPKTKKLIKFTLNPQSRHRKQFIVQPLGTPSKSKIYRITNEVTRNFLDSLCTPIAYTLIRVSISGLGKIQKQEIL